MKAIGIDIGTTSVCGVVIDTRSGKVIESYTRNSDAFIKGNSSWEKIQSVDKIMEVAMGILNGISKEDVSVIGVTGQMHGIVYTDKNGKAVSPLYTWQDERGNMPYKDTTYAKFLKSCTGYGNVTDFYNIENGIRPGAAENYCTIQDYLVMQLCGLKEPLIHTSNAASFGCYNLKENKFTYNYQPEITTDFMVAGEYMGIPVSVAIGDNQASVFSTVKDENNILLNIGTGSQVSIITDDIITGEDIEIRPYFDNKFIAVGAALCGGRAYSLLKSFYMEILKYVSDVEENQVYGIMKKMLDDKNNDKLIVDTRFAGTRSNPDICGSINGITTSNFTPAHLTAGVLDGMAEELHGMYLKMKSERCGIVGSGNGVRKNSALAEILEQKFNSKMKIPAHLEEAAYGAALFGLIACGIFKSASQAQSIIQYL